MRDLDPRKARNGRYLQLLGYPLRHVGLGVREERVGQQQHVVRPGPPVAHDKIRDEIVAVL